jgi:meso-butanediol dehydrogenase/(S,S)-butanediol dehydrogenase/diacetyl reductase
VDARFADRVAVVTGGGRGIGRAIAERLSDEGARVVIAQRSRPTVPLPEAIGHLSTDLSYASSCGALISTVCRLHGGLDILINNAGVMWETPTESTDVEEWDRTMAINLRAPFLLIKHAIPIMRERGGGAIVNMGSIEALGANPNHSAYCASKAGLHALARSVAVDHGLDGIRCNTVAPGWIDTDLNVDMMRSMPDPDGFRGRVGAVHPLGRTGSPAEVAALVCWLASEEAAFITGQTFVVDGGRTAKLSLP